MFIGVVVLPVGPTDEVEFEAETGEPSVEDVLLLPVCTGKVIVIVVAVDDVVTLPVEYMLLEAPVGPGKVEVLLVLITGESVV